MLLSLSNILFDLRTPRRPWIQEQEGRAIHGHGEKSRNGPHFFIRDAGVKRIQTMAHKSTYYIYTNRPTSLRSISSSVLCNRHLRGLTFGTDERETERHPVFSRDREQKKCVVGINRVGLGTAAEETSANTPVPRAGRHMSRSRPRRPAHCLDRAVVHGRGRR